MLREMRRTGPRRASGMYARPFQQRLDDRNLSRVDRLKGNF